MIVSPPPADLALAPPAAPTADGPRAVAGDWIIELARPEDDAAIRRLAATNPVPGRITLSFEREPSYFAGCRTMGPFVQVAVARHRESGAIGAIACRAVRQRFVNGSEQPVGYLSQLRVDRAYRSRWLGAAMLRALPLLHADGRAPGYLAAISDENDEALGLLVRCARPGFPHFRPVARLRTLALHVRRAAGLPFFGSTSVQERGLEVVPGSAWDVSAVVAFLRREGRRRQFFPAITAGDLGLDGDPAGAAPGDVVIARHRGQVVGVAALWDQSPLKQTVVHAYGGSLRWLRPAYNLGARLMGAAAPPLPAPGARLRSAYASFLAVADDDAGTCEVVLRRLLALAAARGHAHLLIGLAEGDPLLDVARRFPHVAYGSTLYTVSVRSSDGSDRNDGGERFHALPDGRSPQVEIATL